MALTGDKGMNWPNFYVVGAAKAGSTSIHEHLSRHPDVFIPTHKEARFFQPEHPHAWSLERFKALYADAKGYKAIGSVTPFYLSDPLVPARIREVCPGAKIIIVLRDPVERAYAFYFSGYLYSDREPAQSFREALQRYKDKSKNGWEGWDPARDYVEDGLYHSHVSRYLDTFGSEQVLVLLFDDLKKDPNQFLMRIAEHIGVDPGFFKGLDVSEIPNPYHVPKSPAVSWGLRLGVHRLLPRSVTRAMRPIFFNMKKPPLDDESRLWLQQLYDPEITRLEKLLGRQLPELRKSWISALVA